MKKWALVLLFTIQYSLFSNSLSAQCSICTKTTQQLGEQPAKGMTPVFFTLHLPLLAIVGYIGYRWWNNNKEA